MDDRGRHAHSPLQQLLAGSRHAHGLLQRLPAGLGPTMDVQRDPREATAIGRHVYSLLQQQPANRQDLEDAGLGLMTAAQRDLQEAAAISRRVCSPLQQRPPTGGGWRTPTTPRGSGRLTSEHGSRDREVAPKGAS